MRMLSLAVSLAIGAALQFPASPLLAQEVLPWERKSQHSGSTPNNDYAPRSSGSYGSEAPNSYGASSGRAPSRVESYRDPQPRSYSSGPSNYRNDSDVRRQDDYRRDYEEDRRYRPPRQASPRDNEPRYSSNDSYYDRKQPPPIEDHRGTYSESEIVKAGHKFFGALSRGFAKAIEYAFQSQGRPNGYILGEDAGGAFIAGLRYGEGRLYTKNGSSRRVYWQGPSIGYDFGGEGTRTMVLVYNLRGPRDVFRRFGGVQGSAYVIGGASVQFLRNGDITLAPIRTGVGLRLGANIGYLKYTRRPTWNPF